MPGIAFTKSGTMWKWISHQIGTVLYSFLLFNITIHFFMIAWKIIIVQMHKARYNQLALFFNYVNCFNMYYNRGMYKQPQSLSNNVNMRNPSWGCSRHMFSYLAFSFIGNPHNHHVLNMEDKYKMAFWCLPDSCSYLMKNSRSETLTGDGENELS